jgi:hypothetical protein
MMTTTTTAKLIAPAYKILLLFIVQYRIAVMVRLLSFFVLFRFFLQPSQHHPPPRTIAGSFK